MAMYQTRSIYSIIQKFHHSKGHKTPKVHNPELRTSSHGRL